MYRNARLADDPDCHEQSEKMLTSNTVRVRSCVCARTARCIQPRRAASSFVGRVRGSTSISAPPLTIIPNAVTAEEEQLLVMQAQHWFRPRRNEIPYFEHNADNLIFGYRELQRPMHAFSPESRAVLQRLVSTVFPENANHQVGVLREDS